MSVTENAVKHHLELWPDMPFTGGGPDPEMIELFDNFAMDEVIEQNDLPTQTRIAVILASCLATGGISEYRMMVAAALQSGMSAEAVKEVLYQALPYLGMNVVLEFLQATNETLEARGVELPLESGSTTTRETRFEEGVALQKRIFGDEAIDSMRSNAPEGQAHIQDFLSEYCFGDFCSRRFLDVQTRELVTFSFLASLGCAESQLRAHVQGNLNLGTTKQTLVDVITELIPYIGFPKSLNALGIVNEVCK
jgi:4-carboxymuconolactone decarboxylase